MPNLEKRLDALEQAAKLSAAQTKPHTSTMSIEAMQQRFKEILSREEPELTQAEQIQKFKDDLKRMRTNWELRHGNT